MARRVAILPVPLRRLALRVASGLLATLPAVLLGVLPGSAARADEPPAAAVEQPPPLHERIDALVEGASAGPLAPAASDADFLRRVYLDLAGTIPDAATARVFLDDADPGKRAALVDRLLAAPPFARHMQHTFDVMWMERRRDAGIADAEWQEYLHASFAENKPLDQLIRELLAADGADSKLRPAAKFYLDRGGEPNLLARDVGRLFFGRDLQCAQCHDHPSIDDYLQAEYYGLMAFVNRGTVFTDAKEKKTYYAELAEGEVNYKSVFTGAARDHVLPELPQGTPLAEPMLPKEEQYVVAPAKDTRPVPKYSRRAQLAELATCGTSAAFNRNLANRLWAVMMGRGIVHPLDMHHSDNPPVESELLALLADELVATKFDLKAFLRELALSRAYQRASAEPAAAGFALDPGELSPKLGAWQAEVDKLSAELPALEEQATAADVARDEAYAEFSKQSTARDAAEKTRGEAKKVSDEASAALAAAIKLEAEKSDLLAPLVAAKQAADAAGAKLPDDKELAAAAELYQKKSNEVDTALAAARKTIEENRPQVQAASVKLAAADKALESATAAVIQSRATLESADPQAGQLAQQVLAAKSKVGELNACIADAQKALEYPKLIAGAEAAQAEAHAAAEQLASLTAAEAAATADEIAAAGEVVQAAVQKTADSRASAAAGWTALVEQATNRFALAPLKPLSPEQLAWSTMQALGLVDAQQTAQAAEAKKQAEAAGDMPPEERAALEARLLEGLVDKKLGGNIKQFVNLFGQQPGQPTEFAATVHQALFLTNGGLLAGWLNPAGDNLTARLAKLDDPAALADELYLSVLTRRPDDEERARVAEYWKAAEDRPAAVREMVWSLLTSAEFRFNR